MDHRHLEKNIHYGSSEFWYVSRSSIASKILAIGHRLDVWCIICLNMNAMFAKIKPLKILLDSLSLFHFMIKINRAPEKRLLTILSMLREKYERRQITINI